MTPNGDRSRVAEHCRAQARWCAHLGSDLYAELLRRAADDIESGGPLWAVLEDRASDPEQFYTALRIMGAVHRLVLSGRAPALAAHYPSAGGRPGAGVWDTFRATVEEHADEIRANLDRPPQTNEVGRSASLLGGFLVIAWETAHPLRLLEVGASAGLNLRWDRYRYESAGWAWGDSGSPVRFTNVFLGSSTPPSAGVRVVGRNGCDLSPVDPGTDEGRLTLLSYVWPDQLERIERLRAALQIAPDVPAHVERAEAVPWLEGHLAEPHPGTTTVVFHSVVAGYLQEEDRLRFVQTIDDAGRRASDEAPVAWLSLERVEDRFELRLQLWPGGDERILAFSDPHGPPVTWL
jgi:hypothetical protein